MIGVNYTLKCFLLSTKSEAIKLGYALQIDSTPVDTISIVSNRSTGKVALSLIEPNLFGDLKIKAFLINQRKYNWAKAEGFSLNQMLELTKEGIFIEIDPKKLANYLL